MIDIKNAQKYQWGMNCIGWHLLNKPTLSIIQETIPSGSAETLHRHNKSQQFFYILKGCGTFILNGKEEILKSFQGIYVPPNNIHQIKNNSTEDLEFLVISQPHAHGDRENIE